MSAAWNPQRGHAAPRASRWLGSPRGGFRPAPGVSLAPHLQLVRPVTGAPGLNVWVADQLTLQIEVAVKFAPEALMGAAALAGSRPSAAASEEVPRFLRQARCAARIGDPHLLQILEQGKIKGVPFIVTKLLEGRSLSQRLLSGPLPISEVLAVLEQIAGVLAKAHPLGLFHGSISPEHVFLSETAGQPFVEIANFADVVDETWANDSAAQLAPEAPSRKQAYLSPEQILHGAGSSAAADIWALGVLIYELLTTTLPFEAPSAAALSVAICNGQFSPPSHYRADVPPAVDVWFARVFAKEAGARLLEPTELVRAFSHALGSARAVPEGAPAVAGEVRELDNDFETEERTVRWELPSDWTERQSSGVPGSQYPATERAPAPLPPSSLPPPVPAPANLAPPPLPASGPPPLPDRPPSSRPPPVAGYTPLSLPPPPRVSTALLSPYLPAAPVQAAPLARPAGHQRARGLLAGALLGGAVAFAAWGYQSWSEEGDGGGSDAAADSRAPAPRAPESTVEGRLRSAAAASTTRSAAHPSSPPAEDLPRILQTDDLLPAPEEGGDEGPGELDDGAEASGPANAAAHDAAEARATHEAHAPTPTNARKARPEPAARRAAAVVRPSAPHRAPRREAPPRHRKQVSASADCNPPYYFDSNNIRRLKLECL